MEINGRIFTGFSVQQDDADEFINAINGTSQRRVSGRRDDDGRIELVAADGRNIEVNVVGNAGAVTGLNSDVTRAGLRLVSDSQFEVMGVEGEIGMVPNAIVAVTANNTVDTIDVTTRPGANDALLILDRAIQQIASDRAELGAVQNRMQSTINNLSSVSENAAAAKSRILDAILLQVSKPCCIRYLRRLQQLSWHRRTRYHSRPCLSFSKGDIRSQ